MRMGLTQLTVAVAAALGAVTIGSIGVTTAAELSLRHVVQQETRSLTTLAVANTLEKSVLDLETGLRGYLLTDQPRFLQPYRFALAAYPGQARSLKALTAGSPAQQARAAAITSAIGVYVRDYTRPLIRQARAGHLAAARSPRATGAGKARVDAIRARFAALTQADVRAAAANARSAHHLRSLVLVAGIGSMVLAAAAFVAISFAVRRTVAIPLRRLAGAAGQVTAGELSVRVPAGGVAEVGELASRFNAMTDSLSLQRTELEAQKAELEAQQVQLEESFVALEERKGHAELLQRFGARLAAVSGVSEVSTAALKEFGDAARAEAGALYLFDERTGTFPLTARRGTAAEDVPGVVREGDGLAGLALAERRPVTVSHDQATVPTVGINGRRSAVQELHLPLRHGDRLVGVVSVGRFRDEPFTGPDLEVLGDLAHHAAVACAEAQSQRAVERVAAELAAVLAATDEGFCVIDKVGLVTMANRAALDQTGYARDELLGHSAHDILHHAGADGGPGPDPDCPITRIMRSRTGGRVEDQVFWRRDGSSFPVEYAAYPLSDGDQLTGAVISFRDVSGRKLAARHRDVRHAVTRVLAETASVEEARPRVLAAMCEGLGLDVGLAWGLADQGSRLTRLASYAADGHADLAARLGDMDLAAWEGPAGVAQARLEPALFQDLDAQAARPGLRPDPRLHSAAAFPVISSEGRSIGVLEFFSHRAIATDGLADTLSTVAAQLAHYAERKRAEVQAQRMRDEFVSTVSHELRTPLTSISGWLHILLGGEPGPLTDEQRRFLHTIERNSDRLMRLVGDLLLAGQIESGRLQLDVEDLDLAEIARETAGLLSAQAAAKRIALTVEAPESVVVHGDRARLGQVLDNLVGNAIKFTPEDGQVRVGVDHADGTCRVTVSDTGIGIPADERPKLFQRFYRASSATRQAIGGTGLGLAISKAIAESHDGTIHLADHDGPGTVFVLELPLATREEAHI